jgi:hypothetical protein
MCWLSIFHEMSKRREIVTVHDDSSYPYFPRGLIDFHILDTYVVP